MKRFLAWGVAALLITCGIVVGSFNAEADILTRGKVYLSADRTSYIEYDGTDINFVVGGTERFASTDLDELDGLTAGTVTASKAVVVDSNKDIGDFRNLDVTNLDAGLSGTAGSVDVFPSTAAKGKLAITAADSAGDTITTIVNASQAAARTYTIPDAGASASFVMTEGAQTVAGDKSMTGRVTTTDGVASGTARVVGGRAYASVAANDNLLASGGASAHVDFANTYSIPANTLKANSVLKISGMVRVTDASGVDTLEVKVYIGGSTLTTTTAFDPDAADDFVTYECEVVSRAAPGAAVEHVAKCRWTTEDGIAYATGANILAPTNLATNGALVVKASAKWSATTALTNARQEILNVEIL